MATQGNLDEAMEEYRKAIETDPRSGSAYNHMGLATAMKGNLNDAIGEHRKAIENDPESAFYGWSGTFGVG